MPAEVQLAGVQIRDDDVRKLAGCSGKAGSSTWRASSTNALLLETKVLALTIDEREAIVRALDDPPDSLAELRGVLVREHEWRVREGLVQRRTNEATDSAASGVPVLTTGEGTRCGTEDRTRTGVADGNRLLVRASSLRVPPLA